MVTFTISTCYSREGKGMSRLKNQPLTRGRGKKKNKIGGGFSYIYFSFLILYFFLIKIEPTFTVGGLEAL